MASELYRPADVGVRLRAVAHALGIIAAAYVAAIVLANLAVIGLLLAGFEVNPDSTPVYLLTAMMQFAGFVLTVAVYVRYRDDTALFEWGVPTLRQLGLVLGGFVALYLLNVAAGALTMALGLETATNAVIARGQDNPTIFLYMIPITLLLVAPGEELLFRGVVQGWFRRAYGVVPGVLFASAVFGGIHFLALQGDGVLVYVAVATVLGILLGALYEYTENIVVPIIVHGLYNALLFVVQYLVATGAISVPS